MSVSFIQNVTVLLSTVPQASRCTCTFRFRAQFSNKSPNVGHATKKAGTHYCVQQPLGDNDLELFAAVLRRAVYQWGRGRLHLSEYVSSIGNKQRSNK